MHSTYMIICVSDLHLVNLLILLCFLYQAPLGATSCSKCHCCLGWWVQGRRKRLPVLLWVLTSLGLLCGSPPSFTASRHNWDCWWTSWPLSWSRKQTQWVSQTPTMTLLFRYITKRLNPPPCLYKLPLESAGGWSVCGARRYDHPLFLGVQTQSPHGTPSHFELRV